jgi:PKD repeat protein
MKSGIKILISIICVVMLGCLMGCPSDPDPDPITNPPKIINIKTNPSTTGLFYPNELTVFEANLSGGKPENYIWNFGDGTTSTLSEPVHSYGSSGKYGVTLTVSNKGGKDSSTVIIEVDEQKGSIYFWTNTPVYGQISVNLQGLNGRITSWYSQFPGCVKDIGNARFSNLSWGTYSYTAAGFYGGYWTGKVTLSDNCEVISLN